MSNFTPGPWDHDSGMYDNGMPYHTVFSTKEDITIAEFNAMPEFNPEQGKANAHLIAAAPEMLDALNEALVVLESIEAKTLVGHEGCIWPAEKVRAAIAKAEGKQP